MPASIPAARCSSTARLDRFHSFDPETGRLVCEAGVQLRDIQRFMVPRGWSLPVVPGTQIVSVGGAIANDVHGKNHHRVGSFGHHVRNLTLVRTDGQVVDCGPGLRPDLFAATVGGIGLTGLIATAELQLQPVAGPWLDTEILPYRGLDEFLTLADDFGVPLGAHRLMARLHRRQPHARDLPARQSRGRPVGQAALASATRHARHAARSRCSTG